MEVLPKVYVIDLHVSTYNNLGQLKMLLIKVTTPIVIMLTCAKKLMHLANLILKVNSNQSLQGDVSLM